MGSSRYIAVRVAGAFLGIVLSPVGVSAQESTDRPASAATRVQPVPPAGSSTATGATGRWRVEFEERMTAALARAEALLASEEARRDELARSKTWSALEDGMPSAGQVAAHIRLWDLQIQELQATARGLREKLTAVLESLEPKLKEVAVALSGQGVKVTVGDEPPDDGPEEPAPPSPKSKPEQTFRDCPHCPEMLEVPAGRFNMGSPLSENGRSADEGPVHQVTIDYAFAVGAFEVTRREFGQFVSETGRVMRGSCWTVEDGVRKARPRRSWRNPGFEQTDDHPVTCVSWRDAKAYVRWLSKETSQSYRLLAESEWEYVGRAGTSTPYSWGPRYEDLCRYANGAEPNTSAGHDTGCDDGHARTSPVGFFEPNNFGLHDVSGNASEWVEDCWDSGYEDAPSNGEASEAAGCRQRVFRGGSWYDGPQLHRSAARRKYSEGYRTSDIGFRVARKLSS